jgi:CubicO group peptidase (beta-lactamase class C family)
MPKKPTWSSPSLLVCALAGLCHGAGSPGQERDDRIDTIENDVPRLRSFNDMLEAERAVEAETASLAEWMEEYRVPGVGIAVIDDCEIDWAKGYGRIHAGREVEVRTETYFEAGSVTKLLTAALVLKLVEQGELDLDRDVGDYLESWSIPSSPLRRGKEVTLRMLLSHQSGLCDSTAGGGFSVEAGRVPTLVDVLEGRSPAVNAPARLEAEPGTRWQYSNFGYVVIQLLLEDHLQRPYTELMQEHLFGPLGMTRSTFAHHDKQEIADEAIVPHDEGGTPHPRAMHPTIKAHGELQTTPTDLARFAIALMRSFDGEPDALLSKESAREMLTAAYRIEADEFFGLENLSYGLGAFLLGEGESFYFLHAGTNDPGACSLLIANPMTGKGAVVMTNGAKGMDLYIQLVAVIALVYGWPYHSPVEPR